MSENVIKALQGKSFSISLRANGGTNYSWCLTTLPAGVALASINAVPTSTLDGTFIDWNFSFFALEQGVVKVGFKLLCWSDPEEEAEEVLFDVNIIPHNKGDKLDRFIRYSENSATYNIPPYGFNEGMGVAWPRIAYGYPNCSTQSAVVDYGFPGCVKYGFPDCSTQSAIVEYGFPGCVKYGFPGCSTESMAVKYGFPGCVKYGFPGCSL